MSAEANLYNPAIFAGLPSDSNLTSGPREHTDLALEYLEIVKELKTDTAPSAVKGHLFKLLRPALGRETDLRNQIGKVNPKGNGKGKGYREKRGWVDEYIVIVKELRDRMEVNATVALWLTRLIILQRDKAITSTVEEKSQNPLPIPHWFAQPYVRPPPQSAPFDPEKWDKKKPIIGNLAANIPVAEPLPCKDCPTEDIAKLDKAEAEIALEELPTSGESTRLHWDNSNFS